jgi:hypothetical protein
LWWALCAQDFVPELYARALYAKTFYVYLSQNLFTMELERIIKHLQAAKDIADRLLEKGIEDGSTIQNFDIENFSYTLDDIIMELETIGEFEFLSDEEADGEELDLDIDNDDY